MLKKTVELFKIIDQTSELGKIDSYRLGKIINLDRKTDQIWIDYDGNPFKKPLSAKLGTPRYGFAELALIANQVHSAQIEFVHGNPALPVIRDLFFSASMIDLSNHRLKKSSRYIVEADEIILKGRKRVIIQSGEAKTVYQSEGAEIIEEADLIHSSANVCNRIKGGTIALN